MVSAGPCEAKGGRRNGAGAVARWGRIAAFVAFPLLAGAGACDNALEPIAGTTPVRSRARVAVPGGRVDVAGGNFSVERVDLSIDTRLGTWVLGAVYNSAGDPAGALGDTASGWRFSFDLRYDGETFVDGSGARYAVGSLDADSPIPGSVWHKVDGDEIGTRGGLLHRFGTDGRLVEVRFANRAFPVMRYEGDLLSGRIRTVRIAECTAALACEDVYRLTYDAAGRLVAAEDRAGRVASYAYDAAGMLIAARDGLDTARGWPGFSYEYVGRRLVAIDSSERERVEIAYQWFVPRVVRVLAVGESGTAGSLHAFTYRRGRERGLYETGYRDPEAAEHRFAYTAEGVVREVTHPFLGETHAYYTDPAGRVTVEVDPAGVTTQRQYGADDELEWIVEPNGRVVQFGPVPDAVNRFDPLSSPTSSVYDLAGDLEVRTHDANGDLVQIRDAFGETRSFVWGPLGELVSTTTPDGGRIDLADHGSDGHPRSVTIAGREARLEFDAVGNATVDPRPSPRLGGVSRRFYDEDRNVAAIALEADPPPGDTVAADDVLTVDWRSDGRPLAIHRPFGDDSEFEYDALGRLAVRRDKVSDGALRDGHWSETRFEWDLQNRLEAVTQPNGMRLEQTFDAAGRIASRRGIRFGEVGSSFGVTYRDGRPVAVADPDSGFLETYEYDEAGRLARIVHPGGESREIEYDWRSLPALVRLRMSDASVLASLRLEYESGVRLSLITGTATALLDTHLHARRITGVGYGNGLHRTLQYEPVTGRLLGATTVDPAAAIPIEVTDVADPGGAGLEWLVTTAIDDGSGATEDEEHYVVAGGGTPRLLAWSSGADSRSYSYDPLSNRVAVTDATGASLAVAAFNAERNRLLQLEVDGAVIPYVYDEAGFAVSRGTTSLAWSAEGRPIEIGDVAFAWDALGRRLTRTRGGEVKRWIFGGLVEVDGDGAPAAIGLSAVKIDLAAGNHLYHHMDFRGNPKFTTDQSGAVVRRAVYSPYRRESIDGPPADSPGFALGLDLGELMLVGRRPYDPAAGRFLAPDPIYQLFNQYSYTLGNPVSFWDRTGTISSYAAQGAAIGESVGEIVGGTFGAGAGALAGGVLGGALGPEGSVFGAGAGGYLGAGTVAPVGAAGGKLVGQAVGAELDQEAFEFAMAMAQRTPDTPIVSTGPVCAPTSVFSLPEGDRLIVWLLPLQLLLGWLLVRQPRSRR